MTDEYNETPIERYKRLRACLKSEANKIMEIISSDSSDHPLISELGRIQNDLDDDSFKIGMFGITAAGKSTLTNALLRETILREGLGETTKTLTKICISDNEHPHGKALIQYKTLEEIHKELEDHLKKTEFGFSLNTKMNLDDPAFRAEVKRQIEEADKSDMGIESSCNFMKGLLKGWDESKDLLGKAVLMNIPDSNELTNKEQAATYIALRTVYHDNPITKEGFVFYDGPGIASSYARHTDEAISLAQQVDAAIVVTRVDYKLMPPDKKFLLDAMDVQRMQDRNNLIFVLNQIQRINPSQADPPKSDDQFNECVEEQVNILRQRLDEFGLTDVLIYPVDAACGRWAMEVTKESDNGNALSQLRRYRFTHCGDDAKLNLETSRFNELEQDLMRRLASIRYYGFLANRLDRLVQLNSSYINDKQQILEEINTSLEAFEAAQKRHEENRDRVQKILAGYLNYELPQRIKEEYKDLDTRVSEVVEKSFRAIVNSYLRETRASRFWPSGGLDFWKGVVHRAEPEINELIMEVRDKYEHRYSKVKEEALEKRIPDIFHSYSEQTNLDLKKSNLQEALQITIRGADGIDLRFWQHCKTTLFSAFGLREKKEWDLIRKYLANNYYEQFAEQFKKDIIGWIERDRDQFSSQVMDRFNQLMKQIEKRIVDQVDLANKTKKERQAAEEELKMIILQSETSANNLKELESEIDKARPSNLQVEQVTLHNN